MALRKNSKQLVDEATARIVTLGLDEARRRLDDPDVLFVDVRDIRELDRTGMIPGAVSAPRGMLEFWVDPECPYHRPELAGRRELVLYCQSGWRSALAAAALEDMGVAAVSHLGGGFTAWSEGGLPVVPRGRSPRS